MAKKVKKDNPIIIPGKPIASTVANLGKGLYNKRKLIASELSMSPNDLVSSFGTSYKNYIASPNEVKFSENPTGLYNPMDILGEYMRTKARRKGAIPTEGKGGIGAYGLYEQRPEGENEMFLKIPKVSPLAEKKFYNGGYMHNNYLTSMYDEENEEYSFGGWLKENAGNLLQTAGGIGAMFIPGAQGAGIGMMASGIGGIAGNALAEDPKKIDYSKDIIMPRTVGEKNMTPNVMHFKKGGKIDKVMHEYKHGELHSGSKKGPVVTDRDQAIAIAISEAKKAGEYKKKKKHEFGGEIGMDDNETLINMEGPSHEEGGIQFSPDAELEGGEKVYQDVVFSDAFKISKTMADKYALPSKAIGKTPADYAEEVEKETNKSNANIFDKNTRRMYLGRVKQLSADEGEKRTGNEYETGGPLRKKRYPIWSDPDPRAMWPFKTVANSTNQYDNTGNTFNDWRNNITNRVEEYQSRDKRSLLDWISEPFNELNPYYNENTKVEKPVVNQNIQKVPVGNEVWENVQYTGKSLPEIVVTANRPVKKSSNQGMTNQIPQTTSQQITEESNWMSDINNLRYNPHTHDTPIAFEGLNLAPKIDTITLAKMNNTPSVSTVKGTKGNFLNNLKESGIGENLLGAVPIAMSAFLAAKNKGYDTVKLPRLHAEEYNPSFVDPEYQLRNIEDTFDTSNTAMSQLSKKDYLRRRTQSSTEEARAKSGVLGQAAAMNVNIKNEKEARDIQNRLQVGSVNLNAAMQEEQINAANKGASDTARDFYLSNLGTMAGELGRDIKLEKANKEYNDRFFQVFPQLFGQNINPETLQITNKGLTLPSTINPLPTGRNVPASIKIDTGSIFPNTPTYNDVNIQNGLYTPYNRVRPGELYRDWRSGFNYNGG